MLRENEAATTDFATHLKCPLCGDRPSHKFFEQLYGSRVCRACWRSFKRRRFVAFSVDYLLVCLILKAMVAVSPARPPGIAPPATIKIVSPLPATPIVVKPPPATAKPWQAVLGYAASLLIFGLYCGLFCMKDGFRGMSPGKWIMGLQVIDRTTRQPIGFGQSLRRNIVLLIPLMPLFVAVELHAGTRTGDRWANTMVIRRRQADRGPFDPGGTHCLNCGYDLTKNESGRCPECGSVCENTQPVSAGRA